MKSANKKLFETLIYAGLWFIVIMLLLLDIMRVRSYTALPLLDVESIGRLSLALLPFVVLFAFNNYCLIPRLLKSGRYVWYFISAIFTIAIIWGWQTAQFAGLFASDGHPGPHMPPFPGPHPLLPMPLFLDVIYDVLIIGVNLAISLLFQHFADRLQQESLKKENAENQLAYLKAQINPHFYMNMLNNIHGMIEIDASKAQDMVIEMSRLMRYMLYESSRPEIALMSEVNFIKDYIALMRVRYPLSAVSISAILPDEKDVVGVTVPPLLFLVFLENAFKHGISYTEESFVSVNLAVEDNKVAFRCINSVHESLRASGHEGIGLENVRRRMDIIYGNDYNLSTEHAESVYSVNLILPLYETQDIDN